MKLILAGLSSLFLYFLLINAVDSVGAYNVASPLKGKVKDDDVSPPLTRSDDRSFFGEGVGGKSSVREMAEYGHAYSRD